MLDIDAEIGPGNGPIFLLGLLQRRLGELGEDGAAAATRNAQARIRHGGPLPEVLDELARQVAHAGRRPMPSTVERITLNQLTVRVDDVARAANWSERTLLQLCFDFLLMRGQGRSLMRFLKNHLAGLPRQATGWTH